MSGDDSSNVCQADPRSLELVPSMEPLKYAEEFVGVFHVESHAIVSDKNGMLFAGV